MTRNPLDRSNAKLVFRDVGVYCMYKEESDTYVWYSQYATNIFYGSGYGVDSQKSEQFRDWVKKNNLPPGNQWTNREHMLCKLKWKT